MDPDSQIQSPLSSYQGTNDPSHQPQLPQQLLLNTLAESNITPTTLASPR